MGKYRENINKKEKSIENPFSPHHPQNHLRHNTHLSHRAEAVTVVFQVGASPSALGHRHQHFEDFVVLIEIKFEDFAVFRIKNFEEKKKNLFNDVSDLNYIFLRLQLAYGVQLVERKSLIVFDEVQFQPLARQAIKSFVEDHRYDYIETGSLISIRKNTEHILIPSEEQRISMYPMDYEEFRWAMGDTATIPLLRSVWEPTESEKHNYEVDFLLSRGTKILPIEVKSSSYKTHASLDAFCKKFSSRITNDRCLIYTKDYVHEGCVKYLPAYLAFFL